jgi:secreted trypsin-like serine protease
MHMFMPLTEKLPTDFKFCFLLKQCLGTWYKQFIFLIFRMAPEIIIGSNTFIIGGTRYKILSARMHPYYNATETEVPVNDIAIITLAENVKEVTEFPKRRRSFFNDYQTPCKILGKGALGFPKNFVPSIKLKLGLVKQVPKSVCKQYWSDRVEYPELAPHTFCMTSNDAAFCSGDSGGPLLCEGELTGIAFFARYCGTGKPDLYVDILAYNDWIDWVIDNEKYHFCHHG